MKGLKNDSIHLIISEEEYGLIKDIIDSPKVSLSLDNLDPRNTNDYINIMDSIVRYNYSALGKGVTKMVSALIKFPIEFIEAFIDSVYKLKYELNMIYTSDVLRYNNLGLDRLSEDHVYKLIELGTSAAISLLDVVDMSRLKNMCIHGGVLLHKDDFILENKYGYYSGDTPEDSISVHFSFHKHPTENIFRILSNVKNFDVKFLNIEDYIDSMIDSYNLSLQDETKYIKHHFPEIYDAILKVYIERLSAVEDDFKEFQIFTKIDGLLELETELGNDSLITAIIKNRKVFKSILLSSWHYNNSWESLVPYITTEDLIYVFSSTQHVDLPVYKLLMTKKNYPEVYKSFIEIFSDPNPPYQMYEGLSRTLRYNTEVLDFFIKNNEKSVILNAIRKYTWDISMSIIFKILTCDDNEIIEELLLSDKSIYQEDIILIKNLTPELELIYKMKK